MTFARFRALGQLARARSLDPPPQLLETVLISLSSHVGGGEGGSRCS